MQCAAQQSRQRNLGTTLDQDKEAGPGWSKGKAAPRPDKLVPAGSPCGTGGLLRTGKRWGVWTVRLLVNSQISR